MLRLFAPAIVLVVWALAWSAGLRGDLVLVFGLTTTAVATIVAEVERARRRGEDGWLRHG